MSHDLEQQGARETEALELVGEAAQRRVEYAFVCSADHNAGWRVRALAIEERLGAPYLARVSLLTEDLDALPANLLGENCRIVIRRGEETRRTINGIVSRVDHGERTERHLLTSIEIVPALDVLRHVEDSRIFQSLSAIEIIDAFLGAYLLEYGRELRIETNASCPQREYCVQYRETALGFFHRLCEEEGLTYFFDQSGEKEVLVVIDDNASCAPSPLLEAAIDVPFLAHRGGDIARAEPVYAFGSSDRLGPTSLTVADFDWTAHTLPFSEEQRSRDAHNRAREQYLHASASTVGEYDKSNRAYTARDIGARVQRGRERQALTSFEYRGSGAVAGFSVGTVFTLSNHPDAALDGEYLLVSVQHRGRDTHVGSAPNDELAPEYENEFVCIPASVPFRPALQTKKPRIAGIQSATVVGPADEEIWTDEHGRIRIQFHWDRVGRNNEDSTCWVRVMQSWAGAGFGAMFIPRIKMEVVVSFLDGDPDRPIVTGCVYNGVNTPPITLPDDKTQSVLRTSSSPGGNGWNELRFEDRAGDERVYLHAEKDLAEDVKNDQATHVWGNQQNHVEGNQTQRIEGDQSERIDGNQTMRVGGERETTIVGDERNRLESHRSTHIARTDALIVEESQDVSIIGRYTGSFEGGREVVIERGDTETVAASNKRTSVEGAYEIEVTDRFRVRRDGTHVLVDEAVELSSPARVMLVVGGNHVALESDGTVTVSAASELILQCGSSKISLKSDGHIELDGSAGVDVVSGSSSVSLAPSGVAISGTQIDVEGTGPVNIAGSIVKVN